MGKWKSKSHLGIWKAKGQCNPEVTLQIYICNFLIHEKGQNFSSHTFFWVVNESGQFSSFSLVLWVWVVEVFCWFDLMLFIAICRQFSYDVNNVDYFECTHVFWTTSFLHAKFRIIVELIIRCIWSQGYWSLGNFELLHFSLSSHMKSKLYINYSLNYFMNLMICLFLWLDLEQILQDILVLD